MKYLVAVASCEYEPWIMLENGIRKTWLNIPTDDDLKVLFYYAKPGQETVIGDKLYVDCPDTPQMQLKKSLLLLRHALKYEDLSCVFFTNLSSYVRLDKIVDIFRNASREFYSGLIGHDGNIHFASGAGFFLSRDLVQMIIDNENEMMDLCTRVVADVAYAHFLVRRGIKIIPQKRLDIRVNDRLCPQMLQDHYHFRCKQQGDRHGDVVIMECIHSLLGYVI